MNDTILTKHIFIFILIIWILLYEVNKKIVFLSTNSDTTWTKKEKLISWILIKRYVMKDEQYRSKNPSEYDTTMLQLCYE